MFRRAFPYVLFLFCFPGHLFAQEVVTGLPSNPVYSKTSKDKSVKGFQAEPAGLPFFDDFTGNSPFPDPMKWTDNSVFINNTFTENQLTEGVATFDAIDSRGRLYETGVANGFMADQLTSREIDLEYPANANIWLSFVVEPGGLSDMPEPNDSLVVQFYSPLDTIWHSVWRTPGYTSPGFRNIIIPVNQSRYLQKGFRFRFVNYASFARNTGDLSLTGNCDIWNIDYVKIDQNRNAADTIYRDVAFRLPLRSLLLEYEAMPWKQFLEVRDAQMGSFISTVYRNNDVIVRNVTRDFEILDVYAGLKETFTGGAVNVTPLSDMQYNAPLRYDFESVSTDSALFRITCSLKTDEFDPKKNDTLVYYQVFSNYFAYDDGTSEGGYGINGLGSRNAMFAHRFTSYLNDTIRAVDICFNDSYQDANKRSFDIVIWDDNNGMPGNVIYTKEEVMVENGSKLNGFYRYNIPGGVAVNGTFYAGWKQRSETFLNAGYDINTPHKDKQFYWLNGNWNQSQVKGSVMIRPVTGLPITTGTDEPVKEKDIIRIWPNPAAEYITINIKEYPYSSHAIITVLDIAGRELMKVPYTEMLDISDLRKGIYFVVITADGRRIGINRLIKSR
jgi:hypothetical protein